MNAMYSENKILPLQGLRFLFAVGIVLLHLPYPIGMANIAPYGYIGVTFFFILSGYLSVSSNTNDIYAYYKKKCVRIYPIHWFALICMMVAYTPTSSYWNADTWWILILQIFLLQGYYPEVSVNISFNGPAWFLCAILLFYILVPFFQRLRRENILVFYVVTCCWWIVSYVFNVCIGGLPYEKYAWGGCCFPLTRMSECLLGMCLYDFSKRGHLKLGTWTEICTLLFFIFTLYTAQYAPKICLQIYWWLPALVLIVYVGANSKGVLSKILSSKVLVRGGGVSMEIFMFHSIAIRLVPSIEHFVGRFPFGLEVSLVLIIMACMIIVWHYLIEPRIMALTKQLCHLK